MRLALVLVLVALVAGGIVPRALPRFGRPLPPPLGFTLIIATHERTPLLPPLLHHLTTDPPFSLRTILVIWQNVDTPLPGFLRPAALLVEYGHRVSIVVRVSRRNSMNERFRPELDWGTPIKTPHVMIMDDDVVLRRSTLEWGYQQFLLANPTSGADLDRGRIVGFTGRDFVETIEGGWSYVTQPKSSYSLVLSNAAWLKREWLEMYWDPSRQMSDLRDYVDQVFNCDDILINFLVSNLTHSAPLLLQPNVPLRTIPTDGLWNRQTQAKTFSSTDELAQDDRSGRPAHFATRTHCLTHYFDVFARPSTLPGQPTPHSKSRSHFPLRRSRTSHSEDVEDHARWIEPNESWEEPVWVLADPASFSVEEVDEIGLMTDDEFAAWEALQPDLLERAAGTGEKVKDEL